MSGAMGSHHSSRSITDVWLTPPEILDALGGWASFDLDPSAADDRPWPTARRHLVKADDGLAHDWHGRVWLNPPYSPRMDPWLAKLADHGSGTALIFARTETRMFHEQVWQRADALLFLAGRLHFHRPDGSRALENAGAPSVLVAYGQADASVLRSCGLRGAYVGLRAVDASEGAA